MRSLALSLAAALAAATPACGAADYQVKGDRQGEVNGRSFEFVSTKPDGTEWTFRARGNSLWVGYVGEEKVDDLGETRLRADEATRLWELVDLVDVGGRRPGREDRKHGTVTLRLREPDDDGHDLTIVRVSRRTSDDDVLALADFLIELVQRHHHVEPAF